MTFVVMGMASFETQANADHIYDQAKSVAVNASVSRIGEPGERTSYYGVYEEQADGTLAPLRHWHIDTFGIVREGQVDPNDPPAWIQPTGGQDAYPLLDVRGDPTRVTHNGETWANQIAANTQAPGVSGWTIEGAEEPEGYPAWQPWTSGLNEDLYQVGDRVSHNGSDWEATNGNNYWEPGVFGWVQL